MSTLPRRIFGSIERCWRTAKDLREKMTEYLRLQEDDLPSPSTVLVSLLSFIGLIIVGGIAIAYPTTSVRTFAITVGTIEVAAIAVLLIRDIISYRHRTYSKNLASTVLQSALTVLIMAVLYARVWYPGLILEVSQFQQQSMSKFRYPAVMFMQEVGAHYQANLTADQPWFCYVGSRQPTAPSCSSLSAEGVLASESCNCSDSWRQEILPHFTENDNKRVLHFNPKPNLAANNTAQFLTLQFSFNYNTSTANPILGYPNVWVLVYDPTTDPYVAYASGDALLTLMNVNGVTTLALTAKYINRGRKSYYRYDVVVSTSPMMNLVCDVAGDPKDYHDCFASILIRIPSLERTVIHKRTALVWTDVVGSAGSYLALSQLVSWLFSGSFSAR